MANSLNENLKGRWVLLSASHYPGTEAERTFYCETGFGCSPFTSGTAIFGYFSEGGQKARVEGYEVERLLG